MEPSPQGGRRQRDMGETIWKGWKTRGDPREVERTGGVVPRDRMEEETPKVQKTGVEEDPEDEM